MVSRAFSPRTLLLAGLLVLVLAAVYAPALRGDFLWDDDAHIGANPAIVGPLGLKDIWTSAQANYFPLVLSSFWVQHALWGLNPVGYHVVTLAFHMGAALLLWAVLRRLAVPGAWLGAALWALHPVQVESVAWICELKNTQSAVFFLAAILFWLRWLDLRGDTAEFTGKAQVAPVPWWYYFLAVGCGVGAVLSKSSTVMLPVILALCTWWRRGRITSRDVFPLAPFFAVSAAAAGWTIWEQMFRQQAEGGEWALSLVERGLLAGRVIWFYLGKLLWPANLAFIYPRWAIDAGSLLGYLPALAALGALVVVAWRRSRRRAAFFVAVCFVTLLFPVLGFFNIYFFRFSFVGDHFQYLASMAPMALIAGMVMQLRERVRWLAGAVMLIAFALLTVSQSRDYRDPESLWRATLARNPAAWMAWNNLGETVARKGRNAEAVACYQRALELNPSDADAHHNLGVQALMARDVPGALGHFQRALELNPRNARSHNGYGLALAASGKAAEAVPHYELALRIQPDFPQATKNLAMALSGLGRLADALPHYAKIVALEPENAAAHRDFADSLSELGQWAESARHYEAVLRLEPPTADIQARLGVALAQAGRRDEGIAALQRAVQLDANDPEIHRNLGLILREAGRTGEAAEHLARAAALSGRGRR